MNTFIDKDLYGIFISHYTRCELIGISFMQKAVVVILLYISMYVCMYTFEMSFMVAKELLEFRGLVYSVYTTYFIPELQRVKCI